MQNYSTEPKSRIELLVNLANDVTKIKGTDRYGNTWNIELNNDGTQLWVRHRNGIINEGGLNERERQWNDDTGLNNKPTIWRHKDK